MPCVGFVLRPQKRPRVLTATLAAAAEARGLSLLALDPSSTPEQWRSAGVDVIVHKVPDETGIDARLEAWAAAAGPAGGVLLDPPACVKLLQDREAMLQPLAAGPLLLTQQGPSAAAGTPHHQASVQQPSSVLVSIPHQVVLQPGCSVQQALQQMAAAGLTMPVLVKPLSSAATDSHRPHADTPTETAAAAAAGEVAAAAAAGPGHDSHTLGLIWTEEGLKALLHDGQNQQADAVIMAAQQQQTHQPRQQEEGLQVDVQTLPNACLPQQSSTSLQIALPAVLQQYVPHQALYKLYVIGPSCVLTRRSTLTPDILEAATAAAPAGRAGVVILPRLSADKWVAVQAAQQQPQQQALNDVAPAANSASSSSSNVDGGGAAIADASVADDPAAPPLWAMQQLAAHLRAALGLNLFNVDIIAPSEGLQASGEGGCCAAGLAVNGRYESCIGVDGGQGPQQAAAQLDERQQQLLVVDINYFPGYDKVPGAELLFAQFLAQCTR